ncbi:MAG TPA: DUF58 domain-containing protein [Candidatus Thermoplasmatota archaeon]|nr:DUF58 domain-containing protein [Candidatus Thermoplasmatota archaeon]
MLTRAGTTLLFAGLGLLTSGLAVGNLFYVSLSLAPLGVFLAALALEAPHGVRATLRVSRTAPRAGDEVLVEVDYEVAKGAGALEISVPLPESFTLVSGRNVRLLAKAPGKPLRGTISFTVAAEKRGTVAVGPVMAESIHAAAVRAPVTEAVAPAARLDVKPATPPVRRIRGLTGLARQMFPENDASVSGIQTTEFRDIREYQAGDSIKDVNWRATTRQAGFHTGTATPLVNEYEREGKKSVWLFLDAAPYMQVGTTVENSFEHAIKAASAIAQFYLDRGYKLGAYVYNHDRSVFLYPEVGRKQLLRWQKAVVALEPGADATEGLLAGVERAHRFLVQEKPLVVVVTRLGKADEPFYLALRKLRGVTGRRRRRIPVLVVTTVVHAAIPNKTEYGRDVVQLLRRRERPALQRARRSGARVVEWDPSVAPFESVLLQSARGRIAR